MRRWAVDSRIGAQILGLLTTLSLAGRRKELATAKHEEDKGRRTQLYVEAIGTITQKVGVPAPPGAFEAQQGIELLAHVQLRLLERRTGLVFLLLAAL